MEVFDKVTVSVRKGKGLALVEETTPLRLW